MSDVDVFEGTNPVTGLEHLGRAIVDKNGIPSGSPANYENLRGKGGEDDSLPDVQDVIAALQAEFGKPPEG